MISHLRLSRLHRRIGWHCDAFGQQLGQQGRVANRARAAQAPRTPLSLKTHSHD